MGDSPDAPSRDVWLAERRRGVGGSDVAAVLGMDPYRTALDVYYDKRGQHPTPIDDDDPPEPILWGRLLEPVVADEVCRREAIVAKYVGTMEHPQHDWMRVNIDRALFQADDVPSVHASNPGVLECKTTSAWRAADWADGDAPMPAVVQVCWAFAVTGWRWGKVAGLIGGQRLEIRDVDYDDTVVESLVERVGSFWHDHVAVGKPPPAVAEDRGLLGRLYEGGRGTTAASPVVIDAAHMYRQAATMESLHRSKKRAAEATLRQELGDHDEAVDPDTGERVAWFTSVKQVDVAAYTRPAHRRMYVRKDRS